MLKTDRQSCMISSLQTAIEASLLICGCSLFMHGGHTNFVTDFAWNPNDPWVMVSAAEDNLIQCWKVASTIIGDEQDVPADELEA